MHTALLSMIIAEISEQGGTFAKTIHSNCKNKCRMITNTKLLHFASSPGKHYALNTCKCGVVLAAGCAETTTAALQAIMQHHNGRHWNFNTL